MPYQLMNGLWVPTPAKSRGEKTITVFLDESSDEKQETVYVVAGYIGAEANWKNFASGWNAVMTKCGLDGFTFHMNLFEHGGEEPWKTLKADKARHEAMLNGLLDVIRDNKLYPFGSMIRLKTYEEVKHKISWDNPYKLCLENALFAADQLCEVAKGGSITFVCDENQQCAEWVEEAFERMKKHNPALANVFGKITFSTDDANVELCASDLLAFEVRKNVYNTIHAPKVPMRYPLRRVLTDGPSQFFEVDFSKVKDQKLIWTPGDP
jgi:hypothetical protein